MARIPRPAASVVLFALLVAGCGGGGAQTQAPSRAATYQRLVAGYVDYARCARAHGMPNLPDPQVDDQGNDHYPTLGASGSWRWPQSVLTGCASVWRRVHAIRDQFDSFAKQRFSPGDFRSAQTFARCIRRHGFPTFPDPDPSGRSSAPMPPGFSKLNPSPQALAAIHACSTK